jgi:transposase
VPALPSSVLEPLWVQVAALLPVRQDTHPLDCHRPRIADRIVFDKLIQLLVFGCGYRRIADHTCSATTLRRRRDEWITAGVVKQLHQAVLAAYDRMHGLEEQLAVDGCTTKAPCGGQVAGPSPVDRHKQGLKRLVAVEAGASRWRRRQPQPTSATTGCWPPPWTPSGCSARYPPGRSCTWMLAMTTSRAGRS